MRMPPIKPALLLVDFMNPLDFPGSEKLAPDALRAARATHALREKLGRRVPVIYANDNFGRWESQFDSVMAQCEARGGTPAQLVRLLAPREGDFSILKPRHSAFFGTPLQFLLDDLEANTLIITGIAADSCVTFTALDAYLHRYRLWVPADCIAAESARLKRRALDHLGRVAKAAVDAGSGAPAQVLGKLRKVEL
jgi:nicotinamidase-related amidase